MFVYPSATTILRDYAGQARAALAGQLIREQDEAVHDLRVAFRRLRSVLRPFLELYADKRLDAAAQIFRRFAQHTGQVRDEEVLREVLGSLTLSAADSQSLQRWQAGRARREHGLRERMAAFAERTDPLSPRQKLDVLRATLVHAPRDNPPLTQFVQSTLRHAYNRLRKRAAHARQDHGEDLHAVRIAAKKLRYFAEFSLRALPDPPAPQQEALAHAIKITTRIQKRLGVVHDYDAAIATVCRALTLRRELQATILTQLWDHRQKAAQHAWTTLRKDIEKIDNKCG